MADIYISYGKNLREMAYSIMREANIAAMLKPDMRVCVKPNLVVAKPADDGATTHPEIIAGIIEFLQDNQIRDIIIAEGAWVGESTARAWKVCGYDRLAEKYGVKLVDTKTDRVITRHCEGMELPVSETPATSDFLINVPVLKGHCQTSLTCCLKNMKGCIPDSEKRRYHTMGLHRPIAALNTAIRPKLHIIDGVCGDLSFEEGGNPVEADRLLLGFDPVLLDSYCARLMGYEPDDIGYLKYAKLYGIGKYADDSTTVAEQNAGMRPKTGPPRGRTAKSLGNYIDEDGACSACYAALILALDKSGAKPREKIKIGQGFKGKSHSGFGVGNCAAGCERHVAGCPPKAADIIREL